MGIEIGHFALILACALAAISAAGGLLLWRSGNRLAAVLAQSAVLQFVLVAAAFVTVVQAFLTSDFSLALAANNSHSHKPVIFKISGVWGNHEGSLLLWILILVLFGALVAAFGRRLPPIFSIPSSGRRACSSPASEDLRFSPPIPSNA